MLGRGAKSQMPIQCMYCTSCRRIKLIMEFTDVIMESRVPNAVIIVVGMPFTKYSLDNLEKLKQHVQAR